MSHREVKYHQYVCLVDWHRRLSRQRNTVGRYRVGAKCEKEAEKLLKEAIGFGSIVVYYEDKDPKPSLAVEYKQVMREDFYFDEERNCHSARLVPARHATDEFPKE